MSLTTAPVRYHLVLSAPAGRVSKGGHAVVVAAMICKLFHAYDVRRLSRLLALKQQFGYLFREGAGSGRYCLSTQGWQGLPTGWSTHS